MKLLINNSNLRIESGKNVKKLRDSRRDWERIGVENWGIYRSLRNEKKK